MHEYEEMFTFVDNQIKLTNPISSEGKARIQYSRFQHIERVYAWMKRIVSELSPEISIREKELQIATIFHDAGYGVLEDSKRHAESSTIICRNYLQDHGYENDFILGVEFLVANHSRKDLLTKQDTPIELVILMEADLLDDMGALGIVMDTMIESKLEEVTYQKIYEHIVKYTVKDLQVSPMVTLPGKRFWKEKQNLTEEFVSQFKRDINL
ncbi:MAG: HD domain-containing protein [Mobilitalea sp.]